MNIWFGVVCLIILCGSSAYADDLKPSDFAKGIVLDVENDASIYKFTLPEFVYEGMTRPGLGDMRVFNNAGEVVPFVVRHNNEKLRKKKDMLPAVSLPVFPVYDNRRDKGDRSIALNLKIDNSGALVLATDNQTNNVDSGKRGVDSYIIDASMLKNSPDRLSLEWDYGKKDLVAEVSIQGSNDLAHWTNIVKTAAIADIAFGRYFLKQTDIRVPAFDFNYLKLRWLENVDVVWLTGVHAVFPDRYRYEEQPRRWTQVNPVKSDTEASEYYFSTDYYLPVDRVKIFFPQKNTLVNAELKSRKNEKDPWKKKFGGLLYNLTVEGKKLEHDVIPVRVDEEFQWLFKVDSSGGGFGRGLPLIEIGWHPHTVMFVARGEGPFVLAYGSGVVRAADARMESFLAGLHREKEKDLVREARMIASVELGGRKQLEKPRPPIQWTNIFLWIILIGGVAAAGIMALSLYRQMNSKPA